ncbi:MAG: TolC family outer membrane protein [Burkholderiales bacterium]|nr:TolC family outer membrane protein [Burkholderiales bacterium]
MLAAQFFRGNIQKTRFANGISLALVLMFSANAQAQDLISVYRLAYSNDAALQSARATLEAEREKYPQARAALLPSASLAFQKQNQTSEFTVEGSPPGQPVKTSPKAFGLTLTQPLFRLQAFETFEQSKLLVSKAEIDFMNAEQELALKVAQSYFDILIAKDNLSTLLKQKIAITEQLAAAKRNFEVGTATITDQQEAQARFDLAVSQEIAANNDLFVKTAALENLIGGPAPELSPLQAGTALKKPSPEVQATWVDAATGNNLTVQSVRLLTEVSRREVSKARAGHLPTLDLVLAKNETSGSRFGPTVSSTASESATLQLNVPLFAGGGTQARVRETLNLQNKTMADLESAKRTAAQTARQTFAGVNSGLAQVAALEAAERSSQLALESNKLGYQVGVRINIDVLNAQQQLSSTQRDLARAKYETLLNGLKLKASTGALREADLAEISELMQAVAVKP